MIGELKWDHIGKRWSALSVARAAATKTFLPESSVNPPFPLPSQSPLVQHCVLIKKHMEPSALLYDARGNAGRNILRAQFERPGGITRPGGRCQPPDGVCSTLRDGRPEGEVGEEGTLRELTPRSADERGRSCGRCGTCRSRIERVQRCDKGPPVGGSRSPPCFWVDVVGKQPWSTCLRSLFAPPVSRGQFTRILRRFSPTSPSSVCSLAR